MRLTLRILGLELFDLNLTTEDEASAEPGDVMSTPISFMPAAGDQRWDKGVDYQ